MSLKPLVGDQYTPSDPDEKGMWQAEAKLEESFANSDLLIKDPELDAYIADIIHNLAGARARNIRVYVVRSNAVNAFMDPTGFAVVFSSLLTRMRTEDQLAGILAHEASHYLMKHSILRWRNLKKKLAIRNFGTLAIAYAGIAGGVDTSDLIRSFGNSIIYSLYAYDRHSEEEADALGLRLIAEAGYSPIAMSQIWRQMVEEDTASARARGKKRDRNFSLLSTHPSDDARMVDMAASATEVQTLSPATPRPDRLAAHLAKHRPMLLADLVKLNDTGASLYILQNLSGTVPNGIVQFFTGETYRLRGAEGDDARSLAAYQSAAGDSTAPAEVYRELGNVYLKSGRVDDGKIALRKYLALAPNAPDANMVRFTLNQ